MWFVAWPWLYERSHHGSGEYLKPCTPFTTAEASIADVQANWYMQHVPFNHKGILLRGTASMHDQLRWVKCMHGARYCCNCSAAIAQCTAPFCSIGKAQHFSVQPPSDVVAMADQPVTQLECRGQCLFPRNAKSCIIKWFRWTDAGDAKPISDSCQSLPYSEWTDRKSFPPFRVSVHSKLIINKFIPAYTGRYFCSINVTGKLVRSNNITLKAANASKVGSATVYLLAYTVSFCAVYLYYRSTA